MTADEVRLLRRTAWIIAGLVLIRLIAAAVTPLLIDEAYYWDLSRHLAAGYLDHPPMFALVIRAGTAIAGDTEFGIRLVSILLALPMSYAVYRAAAILFDSVRVGATAAIMLNVTMMVSLGTMLVTPDSPLMLASSFVLLALVKVWQTGRGVWWLAVGIAVGAALESKYTGLFFGPIILIWLLLVPQLRHWLVSPWPYLGGLIALAAFSPTIVWNADHQWVSFIKQFGRAHIEGIRLRFLGELIAGQIGFATPAVFLLGVSGHVALLRGVAGSRAAQILINATVGVFALYFAVHALHDNVHPQWFSPAYPAFAVAAAVAVDRVPWPRRWQVVVDFMARWSVPGAVVLFALLIFQTQTGMLTGYRRDETAKQVAVGFQKVADEIEAIRKRVGARCVFGQDYELTAWLDFYLPRDTCVAQRDERIRWLNAPEPDPTMLSGKLLFIAEDDKVAGLNLEGVFSKVQQLAVIPRRRGPQTIRNYVVLLVEGPKHGVFDYSLPADVR